MLMLDRDFATVVDDYMIAADIGIKAEGCAESRATSDTGGIRVAFRA